MSGNICISCRKPKGTLECGLCHEELCRDCAQFLEESAFSFLRKIPENLTHTQYCPRCFDNEVQPAKDQYEENMEKARKVYFFFDTQKRLIPVLRKSKENVKVLACEDRNETILRLGFAAVEDGFNAIVEAQVTSKKQRNEGYQKTVWQGVGTPVQVDSERLEKRY